MNHPRMARTRNHHPLAAVMFMACALLAAGLWPFPFFKVNHARYDRTAGCLACDPFSLAYLPMSFKNGSPPVMLELWLAFNPQARYTTLARIVSLYDVQTKTEAVMIGQWERGLVVRVRKVSVLTGMPMVAEQGVDSFFTGRDQKTIGIKIGSDRVMVSTADRVMIFDRPILPDCAIMTAGNSTQGDCPWTGGMCIGMGETPGIGSDLSAGGHTGAPALVIPRYFRPVVATVLKPVWRDFFPTLWYVRDAVLNLLGFMPFGYLLMALLRRRSRESLLLAAGTATAMGLLVSLAIELLQIFLPYRSSQMSDVILNTLGTVCGALVFAFWKNRRTPVRSAGPFTSP